MSEEINDQLPFSIMAEKAVLSTILKKPEHLTAAKSEGITSEYFYHPSTKPVFEWLMANEDMERTEMGEIDLNTLIDSLNFTGDLEEIGGSAGITDIYNYTFSYSPWPNWVRTLREHLAMRITAESSHNLAHATDGEDAVQLAKDALERVTRAMTGQGRAVTAKDAAGEFIERFTADHAAGDIPGRPTEIQQIDAISGGMRPGELWVIGGKPSEGKSVLLNQIAGSFIERDEFVVIFSLELMANEVIGRLVSCIDRIDYGHIMQPRKCSTVDLQKIKSGITKLKERKLWIDASANQTSDTIMAESERLKNANGTIGLIVVDYLQQIQGLRGKNETREMEIARASRSLKQLAKSLSCPVISASQLNDEGKTRESRAIEQDADALLIIESDGLRIQKLRNGQRGGLLPLVLNGPMQRFVECHRSEEPQEKPKERARRR